MRKIEVSPDEKGVPRIKLNGKPIIQVGPLDQGWWPDGLYTAPTDEALKYDIEITKKLGFNMIRKHVKVEPQRWYYYGDKLGMLVWQDMPNAHAYEAGEWQKQFETELKELVEQHIQLAVDHHVGAAQRRLGPGRAQEAKTARIGKAPYDKAGTIALGDKVKSWDPTRLVNNASGWTDHGGGDVHDIHDYPGPAAPPIEKKRAIVLGEFGGLGPAGRGAPLAVGQELGLPEHGIEGRADRPLRPPARPALAAHDEPACAPASTRRRPTSRAR